MLHWKQYAAMSNEELHLHDVALYHLACAEGVEKIDLPFCLDSLKQYAEQVRQMTDELLPQFELRSEAFNGSPAYFRMLVMATVLQRDLGIRPDASLNGLNDSEFFGDPGNLWLQGLLQRKKGTCSNLPILYVAVGRRLGYPLKLVRTAHHLFARWDEPDGERLNIECTELGLSCYSDAYYLTWPIRPPADEIKGSIFLKSMTPREELGGFLIQRSGCLSANDRYWEALEAVAAAHGLASHDCLHRKTFDRLSKQWSGKLFARTPPTFPRVEVGLAGRWFPSLPLHEEEQALKLRATEMLLNDPQHQEWWQSLRRNPGKRPRNVPSHVKVQFPPCPIPST